MGNTFEKKKIYPAPELEPSRVVHVSTIQSVEYVDCYNCTGANVNTYGCILCKTYGNGFGKLDKSFSNQKLVLVENGQIITMTPPISTGR